MFVIRHCPAPLDATAANEYEISHLQSAIKRSVAPAGEWKNLPIRWDFGLPPDKGYKG